jgi:hypothetical protein
MQTTFHGISTLQLPQLDVNYGLGERIQLTGEIPYVVANASGQPQATGWGNANPGVKWRFFDQGAQGWQLSTFPVYQTGVSAEAQSKGIGVAGPRFFLPLEVARKVGAFSFALEAGTCISVHGDHEHILGLVVGQQMTARLELDGELYYDTIRGGRKSRRSISADATTCTAASTCCSWPAAVCTAMPPDRSSSSGTSVFRSC